jgi:hypothetical protein
MGRDSGLKPASAYPLALAGRRCAAGSSPFLSSVEFSYSDFDFGVKSGAANFATAEFIPPSTYTANKELDLGALAAGGTVEGDIVIQAPQGRLQGATDLGTEHLR